MNVACNETALHVQIVIPSGLYHHLQFHQSSLKACAECTRRTIATIDALCSNLDSCVRAWLVFAYAREQADARTPSLAGGYGSSLKLGTRSSKCRLFWGLLIL